MLKNLSVIVLFHLLNYKAKIDEALNLIQNADPTGEIEPDTDHLLMLEGEGPGSQV